MGLPCKVTDKEHGLDTNIREVLNHLDTASWMCVHVSAHMQTHTHTHTHTHTRACMDTYTHTNKESTKLPKDNPHHNNNNNNNKKEEKIEKGNVGGTKSVQEQIGDYELPLHTCTHYLCSNKTLMGQKVFKNSSVIRSYLSILTHTTFVLLKRG